jgi:hypothetical protein
MAHVEFELPELDAFVRYCMDADEVVRKLREVQKLKPGDRMPDWLPGNNWGPPLSELCGKAADAIETPIVEMCQELGAKLVHQLRTFTPQEQRSIERVIRLYLTQIGGNAIDDDAIDVQHCKSAASTKILRKMIEDVLGNSAS